MRQVKHRNAKRAVEFFTINAGFKQPYKVLLDGNFVHAALSFKMEDLHKRLGDLLQTSSKKGLKLSVTTCILAELESLGAEVNDAYDWARQQLFHVECAHRQQAPDKCLRGCVGEDNENHYFIATQDVDLRSALGETLGGATLFISVNGVHISQPTETQKGLAAQSISESMMPSQHEMKSKVLGGLHGMKQPLKTSSKFRKMKKRNPNPLSVKQSGGGKKKRPGPRLRNALKAAAEAEAAEKKESEEGEGHKKKKKRRKKQKAEGGSAQEA